MQSCECFNEVKSCNRGLIHFNVFFFVADQQYSLKKPPQIPHTSSTPPRLLHTPTRCPKHTPSLPIHTPLPYTYLPPHTLCTSPHLCHNCTAFFVSFCITFYTAGRNFKTSTDILKLRSIFYKRP